MISLSALRRFYPSISEHRAVEAGISRLLHETLDPKYIAPGGGELGTFHYTQRNFFSILFLGLYRALDIPFERRIFYGMINHSIRGIVTGTDNLLDDEYKEMLPLDFPEGAVRFKSVMHILLFDRFLYTVLDRAVADGLIGRDEKDAVQKAIFRAMVPIGEEEASEESGIETVLPPSEVLTSVHMYKGGNLLRLAFVAPLIIEKDLNHRLALADLGIYSIGLSLQVIDDLTDFYEDIRGHKHNYLVSSIFHEGTTEEKKRLEAARTPGETASPAVDNTYPGSVSRVMEQAIGEALKGFSLLEEGGFWLNRKQAMNVVRYLFYVRGVKNLLDLLPDNGEATLK